MLISIIVPIYNTEKYLDRCIKSITMQTYKEIEIILVNDASTDDSLKICEKYRNLDNRITIINEHENGGQVKAYLKGLEIACGNFIGFVDSDDWIDLEMYEKMFSRIKLDSSDIAACGVKIILNGELIDEYKDKNVYADIYEKDEIVNYFSKPKMKGNPIYENIKYYRCNKLIKKEILLNNIKYIDTEIKVFEDNCIVLPCILDSSKISLIKEDLYYYFQRMDSTMNKFDESVIHSNRKVIKIIDKVFKDRNIQHDMDYEIIGMTQYMLMKILESNKNHKEKYDMLKLLNQDIINTKNFIRLGCNIKISTAFILVKKRMYNLLLLLFKIKVLLNNRHR